MATTYPAIKGQQRNTTFYLTSMQYGEVAKHVELPNENTGAQLLEDAGELQRELNMARVKGEMRDYLLNNDDAFYSAITLFIVPLDLKSELREGDYVFVPGSEDPNQGTLKLLGTATLFPGDGQHRIASIREAIKVNRQLASVQVPVVMLPYKGRDQVRQLFSDLNLNAKSPSKTIGLAFETRDPIVIMTKRVADEFPLFHQRVNMRTNSLPKTSPAVITMSSLYMANQAILSGLAGTSSEKELKAKYQAVGSLPSSDHAVGTAVEPIIEVWDVITASLPEWHDVKDEKVKPSDVRDQYVFAHGLGWQAIAHAAGVIIRSHPDGWAQILTEALESIDWHRSNPVWQGIAMVGTRMNNTGPGIRATAGYVLEQAGFKPDNEYAKPYLEALASSRSATAA